jgi:hypothetical protein
MNTHSFQFSFNVPKQAAKVFPILLEPNIWWTGLFGEDISGESRQINDEFTFRAGDGIHYSRQKLVELQQGKKVTWLVTDSHLSFLHQKDEWTGTRFGFELEEKNGKTKVTFTHDGLTPEIECYDQCTGAWTQYLQQLKRSQSA